MLKYSTCSLEDLEKAKKLSVSVFKPNMKEQFLCLFGKENKDHMFIAKEDDQVVSMVNYYPSTIHHPLFDIRVASIGSVCTDPLYRRRNIAYDLLLNAEKRMIEEEIAVTIISGGGGVYTKFGANEVGNIYQYSLSRNFLFPKQEVEVIPSTLNDLDVMYEIYTKERLSFVRSFDEFKLLFKGQTYPDSWADYPSFIVKYSDRVVGYVILNREMNKRTVSVKELAGERIFVLCALEQILKQLKKLSVRLFLDPTDEMNEYLLSTNPKVVDLHASIKIVDPELLFKNLGNYFYAILGEKSKELSLKYQDQSIFISFQNTLQEFDIYQFNQLVFGQTSDIIKMIRTKELQDLFEQVFPIPFVWVSNLNYQ